MSVTFTVRGQDHVFVNPEFGNQDQLTFQRVTNKTRGGDIIVYRNAEWPTTEVLSLKFNFCSEVDYRRMLNMLRASIGLFINYRDHENKLWLGVIQNPDAEGHQTGRSSFEIELRFEGDYA
jgi:hypothetical protein